MEKSAPRVEHFSDLSFVPRFEYGDIAQLAEVAGSRTAPRSASALPA